MKAVKKLGALIRQYKNLIISVLVGIVTFCILTSDPLGWLAQRRHDRAALYNQIEIERAETEKQIAILEAEREAEVLRIRAEALLPDEITIYIDSGEADEDEPAEGRIRWLVRN